jgi:hypothetical protein
MTRLGLTPMRRLESAGGDVADGARVSRLCFLVVCLDSSAE